MKAFDWACAIWLFVSFAFPGVKMELPVMGGSPGSTTTGANPYVAEAVAILLAVWVLVGQRRRLVPFWVRGIAGIWIGAFVIAFAVGMLHGNSLRTTLTDLRYALLPVYLVVLSSVSRNAGASVLRWGVSGFLCWAGVHAVLFAIEPTGFGNLHLVPLAVPTFVHDTSRMWLYPAMAMAAALVGRNAFPRQVGIVAVAAFFVLLSLIRGLWIAWPAAAIAGGLVAGVLGDLKAAFRFVSGQVVGMAVGLLITAAYLWLASSDGLFLLSFRIRSMGHAMHLTGPEPAVVEAPSWVSPTLRAIARTGRLFHIRGAVGMVNEDASMGDRGGMRDRALELFRESPATGAGLGTTYRYKVSGAAWKEWNNPHNGYLWTLSKMGIVGICLQGLCLLWAAAGLWAMRRSVAFVGCAVAIGVLFGLCEMLQCGLGMHCVVIPLAAIAVFRPGHDHPRHRP